MGQSVVSLGGLLSGSVGDTLVVCSAGQSVVSLGGLLSGSVGGLFGWFAQRVSRWSLWFSPWSLWVV